MILAEKEEVNDKTKSESVRLSVSLSVNLSLAVCLLIDFTVDQSQTVLKSQTSGKTHTYKDVIAVVNIGTCQRNFLFR